VDYIVFPAVDITTNVQEANMDELEINLWPNPAVNKLHIEYHLPENEDIRIAIYDLLGHEVMCIQDVNSMQAGMHHLHADIVDLGSGVYICRIEGLSFSVSKKLVIQ
jgi:hypothetical protein